MPLSRSLDIANSALSLASERSAVVARNISHAGDAGATRKIVRLSTDPGGAPRITSIGRSVPDALLGRVLAAQSDAAKGNVSTAALDRLQVVGDPQSSGTIGAKISELQAALQTYAARPSDATAAANALGRAKAVMTTLHDGADVIEGVRVQADRDIGASVDDLNAQLKQFAMLDTAVTQGSRSGRDVTDELDARDQVLSKIAEQIGLTVIRRTDQGVALYTSGGIPLYDGQVRSVELTSAPLVPGQPGRALLIDGVTASGDGALVDISTGRLAGLIELRDDLTLTYGSQLDEIARGLVAAFAETDQGQPATLPEAAGLFRLAGSAGVPAGATWQIGAARAIEINPRVDPSRGGDLLRLRDGGIAAADPAYVYNPGNSAGYSDRIQQLLGKLGAKIPTAPEADLSPTGSVLDMSASSSGWLQNLRKAKGEQSDFDNAVLDRAQGALDQVAGVNIDEQVVELLDLQRSYQASSKLISTVDAMFDALLQAVR